MSNVLAGIGRGQMEVLNKHIRLRRDMNLFYKNIFKRVDGITVFEEPNQDYFSNHWLSSIIIDKQKTGFNREDFRLYLEKNNIESRPLWKPLHLQPVFLKYPYYGSQVAENLFLTGLCLPSGSNLSSIDKNRIKSVLFEFLN